MLRRVIAAPRKYHGLGNRLRVVCGAAALAQYREREFAYVWPTGKPFGAELTDLWQVDWPRISQLRSRALSLRYPYQDHTLAWLDAAENAAIWQIRTPNALLLPAGAGTWEEQLRKYRPVPSIVAAITDFHSSRLATEPYLGVMVRSHAVSHSFTLAASPVQWYVQRMRELRAEVGGDLRFFVSADSPAAQEQVMAQIPGCVAQTDKGEYNSLQALRAAVVDLYLLAGSVHILGAHYSSFPEIAQLLAGPQLRLETSQTTAAHRFRRSELSRPEDLLAPHVRTPVAL